VEGWRLKPFVLFAELTDEERDQVGRWAQEVEVPSGKPLVEEDRFAYEFFVIESGEAEVIRAGVPIARLGPGDFFGEMALMGHHRRTASVVAAGLMRLVVMSAGDFHTMAERMPQAARRIQEAIEARAKRLLSDD
jgi:CRP-like cAMP-binding protein